MNPSIIVPSVEAAIELAKFISSSYALYSAGHMTMEQLQAAWGAAGIAVKSADARWQAAASADKPAP